MSESVNRKCDKCGFISLNKNDKFCIRCGAVLPKIPVVEPSKPVIKNNQKYCSNCGFIVNDLSEKFCINCGQPIRLSQVQPLAVNTSNKKYCSNCGKEITDKPDIKFCKSCGKPIVSMPSRKELNNSQEIVASKEVKAESDLYFDESIGEPLEKKTIVPEQKEQKNKIEALSIPKLDDILISKPSLEPAPNLIPNPIKTLNIIPQKNLNEINEQKQNLIPLSKSPEEPNTTNNTENIETKSIDSKTNKEIPSEFAESLNNNKVLDIPKNPPISESKIEKEWKKVKIAVCPKCERHCRVVGAEISDSVDWIPFNDVKKIENGKFLVECPGCGVLFLADINLAVPCFEERY